MKAKLLFLSLILSSSMAQARDLGKDLDSLGGNKDIIQRAKALDPKNRVRVVQNRVVDRRLRLELGLNYSAVTGGDPYVDTNYFGGNLDFHINPRWSLGVRHYKSYNSLSREGERVYEAATAKDLNGEYYEVPDVDYSVNTTLAVVNWYPIYGKLNLFDMGVAQFDFYVLAGYGQVELGSGPAPAYTAGGGLGLWLSQHVSSRFEVRYQTYEDQVHTGPRQLDIVVATASIGFLL